LGRNNSNRLGNNKAEPAEAPPVSLLDFVSPTEIVDIPSKGNHYPEGHPLKGKDSVEIRYMTAKDEDILTNQSLIRKGIALDRFLQNIIIDDSIIVEDLLIGDKNALLVAARATAYGAAYDAELQCPQCSVTNELRFDIGSPRMFENQSLEGLNVSSNGDGTFTTTLPMSNFSLQFRLLTGKDENYLSKYIVDNIESEELSLSYEQISMVTVNIHGVEDKEIIQNVLDNITASDARHIKLCLEAVTPNIEVKQDMSCKNCDYTQEVEVPFGIDFFWPNR
tara:strand:- start:3157 stop:3993 length:837 start_codon:yes stop_codon:yes gene_type:complete